LESDRNWEKMRKIAEVTTNWKKVRKNRRKTEAVDTRSRTKGQKEAQSASATATESH
jgi:hypothetical protein